MRNILFLTIILSGIFFECNSQITFQKCYGDVGAIGYSIQQTDDGGYIMAGGINSIGFGSFDVCFVKTNSSGDTLWTRLYGGIDDEVARSVEQTTDGGYIITGGTHGYGAGDYDVYIIKTDAGGDLLWSKTYGGTNADYGYSVKQTSDGGFIVSGLTTSFGVNYNANYLIKLNPNGDTLWTKILPGYNGIGGNSIQVTLDGDFILAGSMSLNKTDTNGNVLWNKSYAGFGQIESVVQISDSGYFLTGTRFWPNEQDVGCVRTDVNGDILWTRVFGGGTFDQGFSGKQTLDGGFILAGYTWSFGAGDRDVYLIRTDGNGDTLWTRTFGGPEYDHGCDIIETTDSGFIVIGQNGSVAEGGIYLVKTDSNGNSGCNQGTTTSNVYTFGIQDTTSTVLSYSVPTIVTIPNTQTQRGSGKSLICSSLSIPEIQNDYSFFVSPNPSQGVFQISFSEKNDYENLVICNTLGEIVFQKEMNGEMFLDIDLSANSKGIYIILLESDDQYQSARICLTN